MLQAEAVIGYARPDLTVVDEAHEGTSFDSVRQAELFAEASRLETGDVVDPALQERDPHVIFFTSGSTGRATRWRRRRALGARDAVHE